MAKSKSIDTYFALRTQLDELKRQEKDIREEMDKAEADIIKFLEDNDLEQVKTEQGSLTLSVKMYPSIRSDKKHEFIDWAVKHDRLDMMIVRANDKSIRDYFEETNDLPDGVETFVKSKLNMRRR